MKFMNNLDCFSSLNSEQMLLTKSLGKLIKAEITNNGVIPFSRYMELALYHPKFGYYNNLLHKFGSEGDFTTAPNISSLFAFGITQQLLELFANNVVSVILEFGAGNGQLMLDVLKYIGDKIDKYYILELSASLVELQKQRVRELYPEYFTKIIWLTQMPDQFDGVILANELLDAQPCETFTMRDNQIFMREVMLDENDNFMYKLREPNLELKIILDDLNLGNYPDGYSSEINLNNRYFIQTLASILNNGAILLIDYGYAQKEYYNIMRNNGTLRGFFHHHQLDEVLIYPGLIDITVNVDFSAIAKAAITHQLDFIGYTSQSNFLLNCGILAELEQLKIDLTDTEYLTLTNQFNRLTSPNEMGEIFKVIGFSKNLDLDNWLGFTSADKSHTL